MTVRVIMNDYGSPNVLEVINEDSRDLASGEVLVKVVASGVNRADLEVRSGKWPIQNEKPFPYIPGIETCGTVARVAPDVHLRIGTPVFTMMQKMGGIHGLREGGYQSHVVAPANTLAVIPEATAIMDIAAIGLAGVTAFHGIKKLELSAGDRVIIHGVSGGVGSVAAMLAAQQRCHVIGVTNRAQTIDRIKQLGVSEVWDVSQKPLLEWCTKKVNAVFEMVGGQMFADSVSCLQHGGRLCSIGALTGGDAHLSIWDLLHELQLTGWSSEDMGCADLQEAIDTLSMMLAEKSLVPPPVTTYKLAEAAQAHRDMEAGRLFGRVLLVP